MWEQSRSEKGKLFYLSYGGKFNNRQPYAIDLPSNETPILVILISDKRATTEWETAVGSWHSQSN